MLTSQEFRGRLNEFQGKIKEKWGQLTDDDFTQAQGNIDQLIGTIERKTGQSREQIEAFFNDLAGGQQGAVQKASQYATQAAETVRQGTSQAVERAREGYDQMYEYSQEGLQSAKEMVRQHPTESLMVALGVGAVVGLLFGLAMRSEA